MRGPVKVLLVSPGVRRTISQDSALLAYTSSDLSRPLRARVDACGYAMQDQAARCNIMPRALFSLGVVPGSGSIRNHTHRNGLLARLRDLLPGRVAIGLTGRGPGGNVLQPGRYRVRLVALPTSEGPPTIRTIAFRIK